MFLFDTCFLPIFIVIAEHADEAARKRQEKALLIKAEEEANKSIEGKAKRVSGANSKKKKKTNSLALLEEALVGDAEKKAKATKKAERLRKEREERLRLEKEKQKTTESSNIDPLFRNTEAMLEGAVEDNNLNVALQDGSSGIDAALDSLSIEKQDDKHPEKRMKALHKAFEERMIPQLKVEHPGLRLSQLKERVFLLWKKSPENPMNWPKNDQSL